MANLITSPENFSAVWTLITGGAVNINQATAPDGTLTADELVDDGLGGAGTAGIQHGGITVDATTQYVLSVFCKPNNGSWFTMQPANFTDPANAFTYFNIFGSALGTLDAEHDSYGMEVYADGWLRPYVAFTTSGDTSGAVRLFSAEQDGTNVLADTDGSHSMYIWGAVLDTGETPGLYTSEAAITVFPSSGSADRLVGGITRDVTRSITRGVTGGW